MYAQDNNSLPVWSHNLSSVHQLISQPILIHFWWELYQRTKDYATRFRTTQPDYSYLPDRDFDWAHTAYGHVQEIIPDDIPHPLGKPVTTTTTVDANLNHCLATGRSVTGCLHFVNHTPIGSYSKRQAIVETATYGSEFVASKTATEQIIDLRHTLRYLGVPIRTKSYLFGDNRSVVTSSTLHIQHWAKDIIYLVIIKLGKQ